MQRLKAFLGYTLAVLATPLVLIAFVASGPLPAVLVEATGLTLSPWVDGGAVRQTVDRGAYQVLLHRPVFDGLVGERKQGFMQIDWTPLSALPERVAEEVDLDEDGEMDFRLEVDVQASRATLTPYNAKAISVEGVYKLENARAVRVILRNPKKM